MNSRKIKTYFIIFCLLWTQNLVAILYKPPEITLTSTAFKHNKPIPLKYTCDGENISPPLSWKHVPQNTKSIAIICDDRDAPGGTFCHWIIFNIPPSITELTENLSKEAHISIQGKAVLQGLNDFKAFGYGGPCPPSGETHHYVFRIYALNKMLTLSSPTKEKFLEAIGNGLLIGYGELVGKYCRISGKEKKKKGEAPVTKKGNKTASSKKRKEEKTETCCDTGY